jgi:hypothetical protein
MGKVWAHESVEVSNDRVVTTFPFGVERMVVSSRVGCVCVLWFSCGDHVDVGNDGVMVEEDEGVCPCSGSRGGKDEVGGMESLLNALSPWGQRGGTDCVMELEAMNPLDVM